MFLFENVIHVNSLNLAYKVYKNHARNTLFIDTFLTPHHCLAQSQEDSGCLVRTEETNTWDRQPLTMSAVCNKLSHSLGHLNPVSQFHFEPQLLCTSDPVSSKYTWKQMTALLLGPGHPHGRPKQRSRLLASVGLSLIFQAIGEETDGRILSHSLLPSLPPALFLHPSV